MHYFSAMLLVMMAACASQTGDPHSNNGVPSANGKASRIRDIADPSLPDHESFIGTQQNVSGAIVIAVDTFDETRDGKGTGDVYVQDIGATSDTPYAGINLFAPTFVPGNLRVSPGDVFDLQGEYQENSRIPSSPPIVFPPGSLLVQLSQPRASFRYEASLPAPVDIDVNELADFAKARRWIGMLVRVRDVTARNAPFTDAKGRVSVDLTPPPEGARGFCGPNPATLVNDLYPVEDLKLTAGAKIKSITGVVLFFCNLRIAPRSAADIQL